MERLRFKDEYGNDYSNWERRRLKDISNFYNGKAHEDIVDENGDYILINSKFVSTQGGVYKKVKKMRTPLKKNDITFVMSDVPNGKAIAKTYFVREDNKFTLNQRIGLIRAVNSAPLFLSYLINRNEYFLRYDNGVGQTNLRKDDIIMFNPLIPSSLDEQEKIGGFLSAIDELVDKQREKVELFKEIKKGYLQKIFSQELRFKDENGNNYPKWKNSCLGDISTLITKGTTPKHYSEVGVNFVKVESLNNRDIVLDKCAKIDIETHQKELKRSILYEGDLLFSIAGTLGRTSYVNKKILPANTNQALSIVRLKEDAVNAEYLISNIYDRKVKEYVYKNVTVGAQPNLNLEQVNKFPIELPSKYEQRKIGGLLKYFNSQIGQEQIKLQEYLNMKKGYMQRLFV